MVTIGDVGSCSATGGHSLEMISYLHDLNVTYWELSWQVLGGVPQHAGTHGRRDRDGRAVHLLRLKRTRTCRHKRSLAAQWHQAGGGHLPTLTWFQLCMCAVWYPWNISGKGKRVWDKRRTKGVVGRDQFDLMLTAECFNDCKSCINLHLPNSSRSTKQLTYRNWQSEGYCCFHPLLGTSKTIGGEVHSAVRWCSLHQHQRETRNKRERLPVLLLFCNSALQGAAFQVRHHWYGQLLTLHFQFVGLTYATCAGLGPVFVKKGNFCRCEPYKWAGPSAFLRNHSRRIDRSHSHNVLGLKTLKPQYNGTSVCDRVCALTPEAVRPPAPPVAQV